MNSCHLISGLRLHRCPYAHHTPTCHDWQVNMRQWQPSHDCSWPFDAHCCHMAERQECPDVKNCKRWLNPVWHRMLYSCTHMATVGVKGLIITDNKRERHQDWVSVTVISCHLTSTPLNTTSVIQSENREQRITDQTRQDDSLLVNSHQRDDSFNDRQATGDDM